MNISRKTFLFRAVATVAFLTALLSSTAAFAGDQMYGFWGSEARQGTSPQQRTYIFQFEYMHDLNDTFSYSIDYFNLGHFNQGIEHHIDTDGGIFWAHTDMFDRKLRLAAGLGASIYYDTTGGTFGHANDDKHGLGTSETLSATWNGFSPLLLTARVNWIQTGVVSTRSVMLGVGVDLGDGSKMARFIGSGSRADRGYPATSNEITFYGVRSVVNQPGDVHAWGWSVEYRRDINSWFQLSESYLDEGKSGLADRQGFISSAWLDKSFFNNRLQLGVGLGLYLAHDSMRQGSQTFVAPVRGFTIAYNVNDHVTIRTVWDRPITNNGRDSDVARIGVGYRF